MSFTKIDKYKILFLDIETVPLVYDYHSLGKNEKLLWEKKMRYYIEEKQQNIDETYKKAGIYAEFGKIVCISIGYITSNNELRIKSLFHDDELVILNDFVDLLNNKFEDFRICGHNSKEFDIPFIARRMMINNIKLPKSLQLMGKKPWENPHFDTMELWRFGDYKHYTSLELLAHTFGIPTPKSDIDGSQVSKVYYKDGDLMRIVKYCEQDVICLTQLFLKMNYQDAIEKDKITIV